MARGTMKVIDASTGLMECTVCGNRHVANLATGGRYQRGAWQCINKESHPAPEEPKP